MIIPQILGGLGNQLFQYAAGYALASLRKTELKPDLTGFENYTLRNLALDSFNVNLTPASKEEVSELKAPHSFGRVKERLLPYRWKRFYKQPNFHFDERFFSLQSPVYLQGYFQSERFFLPVKEEVKKAYTFKQPFRREVAEMAQRLQSLESVSIHIRRGDYGNAEALRMHGVLPLDYYREAIRQVQQSFGTACRFFLFSDDPETAQRGLEFVDVEVISKKLTANHLEDFYLMQHCRHNIIANSSFSWWAAWLNSNPNKIVIAPKAWFNEGPKDTQDLLPKSWLRL